MPRVPTVAGPTVEERPLSGGFQRSLASPDLLAGGARQVGEAGRVMLEVGTQMQERQDADELMRAEAEVKGKYLEWEGEAKQRRGQQAWGVAKEAGDWWDKEATKTGDALTSPRAKALFSREVVKMRGMAVGAFAGYEAGQRRESLDQSAQASITGSINLAAANPGNTELLTATKDDIVKRHQLRAKINGWVPEVAAGELTRDMTNLHKQVIQGLVRVDPGAAEAYFEANKGEIAGSEHAEVGAFAAKATATRVGEQAADGVWQTMGPKGDRDPVTLDTMEAAIRKQLAGKEEASKAAIAGLRERAAAFKDSRRERDDQLEASVNKAIMGGASGQQLRAMPEFLRLSPESARKIMDYVDNKALRAEQRAAASESRAASAEIRAQGQLTRQGTAAYLVYSNPETLVGMSENQVLNLLPSLGNELTTHLMQQRRALAKPEKLAEAKMDRDDFNHVARQMQLPVDDKATPDQKAQMGELHFRVEQVLEATQRRAGKNLTRTEKMDVVRQEMARSVTVNPGIFSANRDVPVIALTPDQVERVVIPPADRQQIAEAMQTMYARTKSPVYAPTSDNLRRFYLLSKSPSADMILPKK